MTTAVASSASKAAATSTTAPTTGPAPKGRTRKPPARVVLGIRSDVSKDGVIAAAMATGDAENTFSLALYLWSKGQGALTYGAGKALSMNQIVALSADPTVWTAPVLDRKGQPVLDSDGKPRTYNPRPMSKGVVNTHMRAGEYMNRIGTTLTPVQAEDVKYAAEGLSNSKGLIPDAERNTMSNRLAADAKDVLTGDALLRAIVAAGDKIRAARKTSHAAKIDDTPKGRIVRTPGAGAPGQNVRPIDQRLADVVKSLTSIVTAMEKTGTVDAPAQTVQVEHLTALMDRIGALPTRNTVDRNGAVKATGKRRSTRKAASPVVVTQAPVVVQSGVPTLAVSQ